ncbi:MAG: sulfotransferase [Pseudomonadales bacterium]
MNRQNSAGQVDLNQLLARGHKLLAASKLNEAEDIALSLLKANDTHPAILSFSANVFIAKGQWIKAERCMRRACDAEPDNHAFVQTLAEILSYIRGCLDEAVELTERAMTMAPNNVQLLKSAGSIYGRAGKHEKAYQVFQQGAELSPDDGKMNYMAATSARFLGELEAAEAYADKAVQQNPEDYEGLFLRSDVRKQTPEHNHVKELEEKIAKGVQGRENQYHHHYVLAKEYEDLGEYAKSFETLQEGANIRRKGMAYKAATDVEVMKTLREVYSAEFFANNEQTGCEDKGPIFILGMPRTGTTLLERMIASHSDVTAAGELNELSQMISQIVKLINKDPKMSKIELVKKSSQLDFKKLGETYIHGTKQYAESCPLWIDKMPINFLYCGLIKLSMPNAKIINLVRHPIDTCYANYKMLFNAGAPYSYSLEDLGEYYSAYYQLMQHWHTVMPGSILSVSYEDITEDFEREARRALEFCDLEWQDQILEFHKSKAASTTASAAQVRQPVYRSSVQRWKHYEKELQPLREILERNGVPC